MGNTNTLLVVGNGFDRQCGLESDYKAFFKWLEAGPDDANNNLWAVHFLNSPRNGNGEGWADVENRLGKVLCDKEFNSLLQMWYKSAVSFSRNMVPEERNARIKSLKEDNKIGDEIAYILQHSNESLS